MKLFGYLVATAALVSVAQPANATLTLFRQITGNVGLSTDGGGSTDQNYDISAFVPVGATVREAYLYQSNFSVVGPFGVTLNGNALAFSPASVNPAFSLNSSRADVTALVAPIINGGIGGTYNFSIVESSGNTDGTALVVIYDLASLPTQTVAILDGFSDVAGDSFQVNFANPLDPTAAGFVADLRLGIGFSCCGQQSRVDVNGTTITTVSGNNDDGEGGISNGQLITVGGDDDGFSTLLPAYEDDGERYDLTPYITLGDTSIDVRTLNPSNDDNIFLAALLISGEGRVVVPTPAPGALALFGLGALALGARRRMR